MASDLPSVPNERMKALTLRASARQAGGLADDEAGRLERSGEAGESLGRVGDRVGAAAGGVEHDDCGFTDVASDEPRGRGGVRHLRLSSYELGIVCGRASGDGGPFNSSSVQGKREDGPDDGGLRAPSRDGQSPRAPIRAAARIGASHLQGQPLLLELQETIASSAATRRSRVVRRPSFSGLLRHCAPRNDDSLGTQ